MAERDPIQLPYRHLSGEGRFAIETDLGNLEAEYVQLWAARGNDVIPPDDGDNEDRVMTFIPSRTADRVEYFAEAWGDDLGVGPNGILDLLLRHALCEYEEALGLRQTVNVKDPSTDIQEIADEVGELRKADHEDTD